MPFTHSIEVRGLDEALAAALEGATAEALQKEALQIRERIGERFASEGQMWGDLWLPRQARERILPRRPLLFHTGRLRASLVDPDDPEHVEIIEQTAGERPTLLLGTRVPYAVAHQWGTANLPARPILTPEVLRGEPNGASLTG
jgi:phage gpG-like protein